MDKFKDLQIENVYTLVRKALKTAFKYKINQR